MRIDIFTRMKIFVEDSLPISTIIKWPAEMLATKRTVRVRGRIKLLINSIITIIGIRGRGVPTGTKWANMCLGRANQANKYCPTHKGSMIVIANTGWAVILKIYGNKLKRFIKAIKKKVVNK